MRKPSLHKLLEVIGVSSWSFSFSPLGVQVLFLRVSEMPFNDERGTLLLNVFAVSAFESAVLFLYRLFVSHTKAHSEYAL